MQVAANLATPEALRARGYRLLVVPWAGRGGRWCAMVYADPARPWRFAARAFGATTEDAVRALLLDAADNREAIDDARSWTDLQVR